MPTIQMICPRDYVLRTRMGHTINFKAGVPTPVVEAAYQEALAKNIVPIARPDGDASAPEMARAQITGSLRDAMIFSALDDLVKRNQTEDFSGGGVPKAAVMSAYVGIPVSASEIGRYWGNYRQLIGENAPLPTHPKVQIVADLQALSTRKQMEEFAAEHDIGVPNAKGKSIKDLKEMLLNQVINQQTTPPAADEYVKPDSLMAD